MSDNLYSDQVKVDGKHGGSKYDGNKAQYSLIPPDALKAVAEVMTEGAKKYSANNWVGLELSRVLDALERHINAFKSGEDYATDSGQHHMAHAIANTMMAYHIAVNKPGQDDRLFSYIIPEEVIADEIDESAEGPCDCIVCDPTNKAYTDKTDGVIEEEFTRADGTKSKIFKIDLGDKSSDKYRAFVEDARQRFEAEKVKRAVVRAESEARAALTAKLDAQKVSAELNTDFAPVKSYYSEDYFIPQLTQSEAVNKAKEDSGEDLVTKYAKKYPQKVTPHDRNLDRKTFLELLWKNYMPPGNHWS
jgi:hypothetical protein